MRRLPRELFRRTQLAILTLLAGELAGQVLCRGGGVLVPGEAGVNLRKTARYAGEYCDPLQRINHLQMTAPIGNSTFDRITHVGEPIASLRQTFVLMPEFRHISVQ